ncbi:hypothetical protein K456DRAFT_54616, partial [Colletotrichum gloeosporioides 23]
MPKLGECFRRCLVIRLLENSKTLSPISEISQSTTLRFQRATTAEAVVDDQRMVTSVKFLHAKS